MLIPGDPTSPPRGPFPFSSLVPVLLGMGRGDGGCAQRGPQRWPVSCVHPSRWHRAVTARALLIGISPDGQAEALEASQGDVFCPNAPTLLHKDSHAPKSAQHAGKHIVM